MFLTEGQLQGTGFFVQWPSGQSLVGSPKLVSWQHKSHQAELKKHLICNLSYIEEKEKSSWLKEQVLIGKIGTDVTGRRQVPGSRVLRLSAVIMTEFPRLMVWGHWTSVAPLPMKLSSRGPAPIMWSSAVLLFPAAWFMSAGALIWPGRPAAKTIRPDLKHLPSLQLMS